MARKPQPVYRPKALQNPTSGFNDGPPPRPVPGTRPVAPPPRPSKGFTPSPRDGRPIPPVPGTRPRVPRNPNVDNRAGLPLIRSLAQPGNASVLLNRLSRKNVK